MDGSEKTEVSEDINVLISGLRNPNSLKRRQARLALDQVGSRAIPALLHSLSSVNYHERWEAAKALGEIAEPAAAPALISALEDGEIDVRWAAMEALIALKRGAVRPLLIALTQRFESAWLRQGAHHVFHALRDLGLLTRLEEKVILALEDIVPQVSVPWAAEAALEDLDFHRREV